MLCNVEESRKEKDAKNWHGQIARTKWNDGTSLMLLDERWLTCQLPVVKRVKVRWHSKQSIICCAICWTVLGLLPVCVHTLHIQFDTFHVAVIAICCYLDESVQRNVDVRQFLRFLIQKVAQDAAQDSLVTYNKHIIIMFQLQKHRV